MEMKLPSNIFQYHLLVIQGLEAFFYILKDANFTKYLIYICLIVIVIWNRMLAVIIYIVISGNNFRIKFEIHAMNKFGHWIKTSLKLFWNWFDPKEPLFGHVWWHRWRKSFILFHSWLYWSFPLKNYFTRLSLMNCVEIFAS